MKIFKMIKEALAKLPGYIFVGGWGKTLVSGLAGELVGKRVEG